MIPILQRNPSEWLVTFVWLFLSRLASCLYVLHFEHSHFIYVSYMSVISCAFLRHPFPFITPWFDSPSLFSLERRIPYGRRPASFPPASWMIAGSKQKISATWPSQDFWDSKPNFSWVAGLHLLNPQSSTQKVGWMFSLPMSHVSRFDLWPTCIYLLGCPVVFLGPLVIRWPQL